MLRLVGVNFFHEVDVLPFDVLLLYDLPRTLEPKSPEALLQVGRAFAIPDRDDVAHLRDGLIRGHEPDAVWFEIAAMFLAIKGNGFPNMNKLKCWAFFPPEVKLTNAGGRHRSSQSFPRS